MSAKDVVAEIERVADVLEDVTGEVEELDVDAHDLATEGGGGAPAARAGASLSEAAEFVGWARQCLREAAAELQEGSE